ncbi:MAG: DJ-1/PfpI family protein [Cyclobacteriaceae bacterium]|nr:DJ-1/PfpI family protein [Cyclobacteriaceae bacterium]
MNSEQTIAFLLLPRVHLMDLSGAAQVFYEASRLGTRQYQLVFTAAESQVLSEQGLQLSNLITLDQLRLKKGDLLLVPGIDSQAFMEGKLEEAIHRVKPWLKAFYDLGVFLGSICSGALILARAGMLDGRKCTTHWKNIEYMREQFPDVTVLEDKLFVYDQRIFTSAGMSSGIDMSLSILEEQQGPVVTAKVAREMVVYLRRNDSDRQQTIYLDYRTHFNPAIHKVQDYIISHPEKNPTLEELGSVGNLSVRNLTRLFKKATGHTIIEFKNSVKVEMARSLLHNRNLTLDAIARQCGFDSARHLRRIWTQTTGTTPKSFQLGLRDSLHDSDSAAR